MSSTRLPEVTHLQFLILDALIEQESAGRDLRAQLKRYGVRSSAPAFYQMMARLESAGFVEGWYEPIRVGDHALKERRYRITAAGKRAAVHTQTFYVDRPAALKPRRSDA